MNSYDFHCSIKDGALIKYTKYVNLIFENLGGVDAPPSHHVASSLDMNAYFISIHVYI